MASGKVFLNIYLTFYFVPGGHLENHHLTFCDIVAILCAPLLRIII